MSRPERHITKARWRWTGAWVLLVCLINSAPGLRDILGGSAGVGRRRVGGRIGHCTRWLRLRWLCDGREVAQQRRL
jgi:hypothetical protein